MTGNINEAEESIVEVMSLYDAVADIFDDVFRSEAEVENHAVWLNQTLQELKTRNVLDAGAGTGEQAIRLWTSGNYNVVVANDFSGPMLQCCKRKLTDARIEYEDGWPKIPNPPFFAVTQLDWPMLDSELPGESFDALVCLGVAFYHLMTTSRLLQALRCWGRLLRSGGYLVFDHPTHDDAITENIRKGDYSPDPWFWNDVKEMKGRSGQSYVVVRGMEFRPLDASPLGWRSYVTYMVGELTHEHRVNKVHSFSSGGAVLDKQAIQTLASQAGFVLTELPVPSPHLHTGVQDYLFRKGVR